MKSCSNKSRLWLGGSLKCVVWLCFFPFSLIPSPFSFPEVHKSVSSRKGGAVTMLEGVFVKVLIYSFVQKLCNL